MAELAKKHKTVEVVTKRAMLTETSLYDRLPEKFLDFVKSSMVPGAEPEGSRKGATSMNPAQAMNPRTRRPLNTSLGKDIGKRY